MFNFFNKNKVEFDGLPVVLSKREAINQYTGQVVKRFLAYRQGNEWRGLIGYEQYRDEMEEVNTKLELILNHLELRYVPEVEKKEPARLLERKPMTLPPDWGEVNPYFLNLVAGELTNKSKKKVSKKKSKK